MDKMHLLISQKGERELEVALMDGDRQVDAVDFGFDKNLDTLLIDSIDKFLKRNKIDPLSIQSVQVSPDIDKNSSLYKIVRTFQSALETLRK